MKSALTSINKPHTDRIFSLEKTVEWRTKPLPKGKHYVYETKNKGGCGKVIGEMEIVEVIKYADVSAIPLAIILCGKVGARELDLYSKGRPLYANVISGAKRYNKPKELGEFKSVRVVRGYHKNGETKIERLMHSKRSLAYGAKMKRMGLRKGFPDIFIPTAMKGFHGLFIELKRDKKSRVSAEQTAWIAYLNKQGYKAVVCYGADEAINEIEKYFKERKNG